MEQHPVPQDITGFKFKLVGDMTLKQFGELAAGAIFAYLFYATNWPAFIKLPFVILFGLLGFALAFFPIEERPLDIWIINFLKAIYKPTLYIWQKNAGVIAFTTAPVVTAPSSGRSPTGGAPTPQPARVSPIPTPPPPPPPPPTPIPTPPKPEEEKAQLSIEDLQKLRDDKLKELQKTEQKAEAVTNAVKTDIYQAQKGPQIVTVDTLAMRRDEKKLADEAQMRQLIEQNKNLINQIETIKTKIQALEGMDTTQLQTQLTNLSTQKDALGTQINTLQSQLEKPKETTPTEQIPTGGGVRVVEKSTVRQATVSLTDIPNVINGLVLNDKGVPLENTILILKDKSGNSIRALKTNQVGQFIASTPLENGTYYLEFERSGYVFDVLEITLNGQIVTPLEIRGRPT